MRIRKGVDSPEYSEFLDHVKKQLPDLSSFDFTKHITLHADIFSLERMPQRENAMEVIQGVLQRNIPKFDHQRVMWSSANKFIAQNKSEEGYCIQIIYYTSRS
jgi:hypothetical protein